MDATLTHELRKLLRSGGIDTVGKSWETPPENLGKDIAWDFNTEIKYSDVLKEEILENGEDHYYDVICDMLIDLDQEIAEKTGLRSYIDNEWFDYDEATTLDYRGDERTRVFGWYKLKDDAK